MTDGAQLAILGPDGAQLAPIGPDPLTIGREEECNLVLESVEVSRLHCRLEELPDGGHRVVDLESTNGLLVNGRQASKADLQPFDRLQLGDYELVYLDPRTDAEQVLEILSSEEDEDTTLRPPAGASLQERLLWLILTLQELRDEEDLDPLLDALLDELLRADRFRRALVLLLDKDSPSGLSAAKLRNAPPDLVRAEALKPYKALVDRTLEENRVLHEPGALSPDGLTICVPIRSHLRPRKERRRFQTGSVHGALLLGASDGAELGPEERRLLKALARQMGILLSSARLQRQATVDPLTTLANRGQIELILREEVERARRAGQSLAILMVDLDDFKPINDTHGHHVGDEVLREVALRLRRGLRLTDFAGRWGGEEFLVVLPGADLEGGRVTANKLLTHFSAAPIGSKALQVTASIGIACLPDHGSDPDLLVDRADIALYRAKTEGKRQAVSFRPELELEAAAGRTRKFSRVGFELAPVSRDTVWLACDLLPPTALGLGETHLGRDPMSTIVLADPRVSRTHGVIDLSPNAMSYRDRSRLGTLLNGERVEGVVGLAFGDRLEIGPYVLHLRQEAGNQLLEETRAIPRQMPFTPD